MIIKNCSLDIPPEVVCQSLLDHVVESLGKEKDEFVGQADDGPYWMSLNRVGNGPPATPKEARLYAAANRLLDHFRPVCQTCGCPVSECHNCV